MSEKTTIRKMRKVDPGRMITKLTGFFRYRGDRLPYTTSTNICAGVAWREMEIVSKNTGYYLTWEVEWKK